MINPKILKTINDLGLNERDSVLFCTLWWLKKYYPKADELLFCNLKEGRVINFENEEDYRINFLKMDAETGEYVLRFPLFVKEKNDQFEEFCKKLAETREFNSRGSINNPQDYPVYNVNQELRDSFDSLKEFDLNKGIRVIISHYNSTKPAKKLSKYLAENFFQDYENWYE